MEELWEAARARLGIFDASRLGLIRTMAVCQAFACAEELAEDEELRDSVRALARALDASAKRSEAFFPLPRGSPPKYLFAGNSESDVLVVHFHGNAEPTGCFPDELLDMGFFVLSVDYPEHAAKIPSFSQVCDAAAAVLEEVALPLGKGKLVVYGRSIGSYPAAHLALLYGNRLEAVVMESGIAVSDWPLDHLEFEPRGGLVPFAPVTTGPRKPATFGKVSPAAAGWCVDNAAKLRASEVPNILVLHGRRDQLCDPREAGAFGEGNQRARVVMLDCEHNDVCHDPGLAPALANFFGSFAEVQQGTPGKRRRQGLA